VGKKWLALHCLFIDFVCDLEAWLEDSIMA